MSEVGKIIDGLNIPKQLIDASRSLTKSLFGEGLKEVGGSIADKIRERRFYNQLTIFTKAQERILAAGLNPKQISLKVLAPMIEYSSLEEDEVLQDKWANLIANALVRNYNDAVQQVAIEVLNKISKEEFHLLEIIFFKVDREVEKNIKYHSNSKFDDDYIRRQCMPGNVEISLYQLHKKDNLPKADLEIHILGLINYGMISWIPKVQVETEPQSPSVFNKLIDVKVKANYVEGQSIKMTPLGFDFMKLCQNPVCKNQ